MSDSLHHVRQVLGEGPSEMARQRQKSRLLSSLSHRSRRRTQLPRVALVSALAGCLLAVALAVALVRRAPSSSDGARVQLGAHFEASEEPTTLPFPDGSQLRLEPHSSGHIEALDDGRIDFVLERGRLAASVRKGAGRTWRYHAGAWVVRVVGTRLTIDWNPEAEALAVEVSQGTVEVVDPDGSRALVTAGKSLRRGRQRGFQTAEPAKTAEPTENNKAAASEASEAAIREPARPVSAAPPRPRAAAALPQTADAPLPLSWEELLARGERGQALDEAMANGVFTRLPTLDDTRALALADAARLERRLDLARLLLQIVLERRGTDAAEAAFLLGRTESDERRLEAARAHFEQAIALAPDGPLVEQARGRLLEVMLELATPEAPEAARKAARQYLDHHPRGAWAGLAQRLTKDGGQR